MYITLLQTVQLDIRLIIFYLKKTPLLQDIIVKTNQKQQYVTHHQH